MFAATEQSPRGLCFFLAALVEMSVLSHCFIITKSQGMGQLSPGSRTGNKNGMPFSLPYPDLRRDRVIWVYH